VALGNWSNASGYMTLAAKEASTAQGWMTIADGINSNARGEGTQTKARNAEASGRFAVANLQSEHASADGMFAAVGDSQRRLIHVRDLLNHTRCWVLPAERLGRGVWASTLSRMPCSTCARKSSARPRTRRSAGRTT
jgi:hypothetical protein